ncbi:MAG TPA: hypothetical protein VKY19_14005 [Ktedonosporobacter sp.]|jgi:hypothetical protein|nr:hypothetical protein [Ktedonosporobacter sp.]
MEEQNGIFQPGSFSSSGEDELLPLGRTPQKIQPRSWFRLNSILLGLLPLLLFSAAGLLVIHEGRCQPHTESDWLAQLSLIFWGVEVVAGLLCLFYRRIRSLAITLLLTLILSVLPGFLVFYLSLLAAFCLRITF